MSRRFFLQNPLRVSPDGSLPSVSSCAAQHAWTTIREFPGYAYTPLRPLNELAESLGLRSILYKDESGRLGLNSFKALGAPYALVRLAASRLSRSNSKEEAALSDVLRGRYRASLSGLSVATATDGNHGLALAWAAALAGCPCRIYLHAGVGEDREEAIRRYGAQIVRVYGNYDDSVIQCQQDAESLGHIVVSDTSYDGYEEIPADVTSGYAVLCMEAFEQLDVRPTHVFVQAGVGSLAAAVCAAFGTRFQSDCPTIVVVEPEEAPCLFESARSGKLTVVEGDLRTSMDGLACGTPSQLAWEVLREKAGGFMLVNDRHAHSARLALGEIPPPAGPIGAGSSGAAGLAGVMRAVENPDVRKTLRLNTASSVFVIGTESSRST